MVYIDGEKQLAGIDFWNPQTRHQQIVYYRNGLPDKTHEIKIVARGEGNLLSGGETVYIDGVQSSSETGVNYF